MKKPFINFKSIIGQLQYPERVSVKTEARNMDIISWEFLTLIVLIFSIVAIIAGIFSAYFGKGKNRAYGILISVVGLVVGLIWVYLINWSDITPFCNINGWDIVYDAIVNLIGILIGALIAVGIFLVTVLKS